MRFRLKSKSQGVLHALQAGQQWIASNKGYRHHVGHPGAMKSLFEVGVLNFGLNRNKGCRLAQNPLASITWIVVVITTVSIYSQYSCPSCCQYY